MHARFLERGSFIRRWTLIDFFPGNIALLLQVMTSLFTTVRKTNQLRSSPANDWVMKVGYIQTLKFYLTAKKNRITKFSNQWMKMESLYWKRQSKHRKQPPWCFPLYLNLYRSYDTGKRPLYGSWRSGVNGHRCWWGGREVEDIGRG